MKPVIRIILRSAVYQLKYMDQVPASAVCNEAVRLAKKRGFQNLSGFVNGVLRTIARQMDQVKLPGASSFQTSFCAVFHSGMDGGNVAFELSGRDGGEDAFLYDGRASDLYPV